MLFATNMMVVAAIAQSITVKGNVKNATNKEVVSAVSVLIKETSEGTFTDDKGNFTITTDLKKLPFTLIFSSIGFEIKEIEVTSADQVINVEFKPSEALGQEVVVSATRTPTRILESPVSIERFGAAAIRNASAPNFYDGLSNLKGVDLTTSGLNFKTASTRGFNGSGNLRFNQLIDGMDNQAPGLNFAVGNVIGITELDVDNVELLSGASSALYGSGGMNGTMLMTSKNPFKYQGVSFQIKQGINHIDNAQRKAAPVYDWEVRWAKAFNNKIAFKIAAKYSKAQDWQAMDTRNILRNNVFSGLKDGDRTTDPNYDGVNVFGDEASASMQAFAQAVRAQVGASPGGALFPYLDGQIASGKTPQQMAADPMLAGIVNFLPFLIPTSTVVNNPYRGTFGAQFVSRQGYDEKDLVDYNTYNLKLTGGLYYKINSNTEASLQAYYGQGTTVYTGSDRYSLKNLKMGQYKLEVKSKNWFGRFYTTQENSGDSYTATTAAVAVNASWKSNQNWFQQYTGTYGAVRLGLGQGLPPTGLPSAQAHGIARNAAETGRLLPGTPAYDDAFQKAISTPISQGGAKFADRTNLYQFEGQYNFTDAIKFAEVIVGASYRIYHLNSAGTIFADTAGPINISEVGAYLQVSKKLFNDVLKLTASGRYDKNENFKGRFTPRFSALIKVAQDNNIRLSYQTAYRFPACQDQYINLQTPSAKLIGGLPEFNTYYKFDTSPAYTAESIVAYRNSVGAGAPNPALLKTAPFSNLKPETVQSFEIGYRGVIEKKLLIDVYAYMSRYNDFIARVAVGRGRSGIAANAPVELASPFTTTNYSFVTNTNTEVKAQGWGASVEYQLPHRFVLMANISGDQLNDVPAGFVAFFNTPKVRYNLGLSNPNVYRNFGFNVIYRWQDKVNWEGTFGSGEIPSFGTVDAQASYTFTKIKSMIKIGTTNLFNKYYRSAFGNPQVGGLYYISFGYNIF